VKSNTYQSYRTTAIRTASPGQLILMLYDGAIRFLERALLGFSNDDPLEFNQTIHNNVTRAQQIIDELNSSLNMAVGGDFAANQRRLYTYFDDVLHSSNVRKDEAGIRDVLNRLTILRNAWAEMLSNQQSSDPSASTRTALSSVG
jgi:flagellar protein FliS